jgi:hypothetical protein
MKIIDILFFPFDPEQPAARDADPVTDESLARYKYFYRILYRSTSVTAVAIKSLQDRLFA